MTTMTAEDLRKLITPAVEADLKAAGLWPERTSSSVPASGLMFSEDAHNAFVVRLVSFLMKHYRQVNLVDSTTGVEVRTFDRSEEGRLRTFHGHTLLHALLAAFAGRVK